MINPLAPWSTQYAQHRAIKPAASVRTLENAEKAYDKCFPFKDGDRAEFIKGYLGTDK